MEHSTTSPKVDSQEESSKEMVGDHNRPLGLLLERMMICFSYLSQTSSGSYNIIETQVMWSLSMLAFSTQVHGFKPGQSHRTFKGEKILSMPSFGGEVKPSVPCRRFAACKRSLNVAWKSTFRQNYQTFLAHRVPPFATRGLSCCVVVGGAPGDRSGNV